MPYWMNCTRCNRDGSDEKIDPDCGKCSGLGQDWRGDDEYEWASRFAASNGLELHYAKEFPKSNRSGKRVYSSLDEYDKASTRPPAPIQPDADEDDDDDMPPGDSVARFVSSYLSLRDQNTRLYSLNAPAEGSLTGSFDLFQLSTRFPFIDHEYLAEAQSTVESLENGLDDTVDISRRMEASELADFLRANPKALGLLRAQELFAHENFHILQACSLRSVFSLAQSYRAIDRWRNYFGVMVLKTPPGAIFREGECIFDAVRHIPNYKKLLGSTLHGLWEKSRQALKAATVRADGLSVMALIEGSAFKVQKMAVRTFAVPTFNVDDQPLYTQAWDTYRAHGGQDELVFLLVCMAALRFGDVRSGYAHPVDIFLSLAKEAANLEGIAQSPFFSPIFGKSFGFGNAPDTDDDESYFRHLDVVDERQKAALARYRREATEEVNDAVDLALAVSRKIAQHVRSHVDGVAAAVDAEQMSASYLDDFFRAFGTDIYEKFPAANTEEFYLRFVLDSGLQQAFGQCSTDAAAQTAVQTIGGNALTGNEVRVLSDMLQRFEALALYDPLKEFPLPYCCKLHPTPGDIRVLMNCQHEESLNVLIRHLCGRELRELID